MHRPRYDDWSWPKGKLDHGEEFPVAAVREVAEETGLRIRLGRPLPGSSYDLVRSKGWARKEVHYWAGPVIDGNGELEHEVDAVAWLGVVAASDRLSYARDREQLRALVRLANGGELDSWPLILVRHAKAVNRSSWRGEDPARPLTGTGRARADALGRLMAAYGVTRVLSSPSTRCTDTVAPFALASGITTRTKVGLSEEGHAARPDGARDHLVRLIERGEPAVLCSHGPVLPRLLHELAHRADGLSAGTPAAPTPVAQALALAIDSGLGKGEALVVHLVGTGPLARVVDLERHRP